MILRVLSYRQPKQNAIYTFLSVDFHRAYWIPVMANEAAQKTAPYASYRSFENFLSHLRDHQPIPSRIDKSAMSHLNYATQQALISTLRLLGLINSEDAPTQRLERLVAASDLERTPIMLDVVRE